MITDLTIIFWTFCIVKAFNNSLRHDYKNWKSRFGIPDKWDFWFNPAISHTNKYRDWVWKLLTPVSDFWHTLWTLWQISFVVYVYLEHGLLQATITGITGVFVIFNGIYAFMRRRAFI